MGREKGTKNNMRNPKEKERIVLEYYSGQIGRNEICRRYKISTSTLRKWREQYKEKGIEGLKSKTGKIKGGNKGLGAKKGKSREEELELRIMRLEIENARLKKGYQVKGVGPTKEYDITFEENTK